MTLFESPPPRPAEGVFADLHRHRRRRRNAAGWIGTIAGLLAVAFVVWSWFGTGASRGAGEPPSEAALAIADRAFFSEEGREIWVESSPELTDIDAVSRACSGIGLGAGAAGAAAADSTARFLGCYTSGMGGTRILVYDPPDDRLDGIAITTAAHEMLHAAYDRLAPPEQAEIDTLMAAEVARVPADHSVHVQIEASVSGRESVRGTESFAYLGTQIVLDGGFAPRLEEIFARYFTDRIALVGVHTQNESMLQGVADELNAALQALVAQEQARVDASAQLEADRAAHEADVAFYNDDSARYNALSPEERTQWSVETIRADGTVVRASWEESLAQRLRDLEARRADIEARQTAPVAAQEAIVAQRADLEARLLDVTALYRAAYPWLELP